MFLVDIVLLVHWEHMSLGVYWRNSCRAKCGIILAWIVQWAVQVDGRAVSYLSVTFFPCVVSCLAFGWW